MALPQVGDKRHRRQGSPKQLSKVCGAVPSETLRVHVACRGLSRVGRLLRAWEDVIPRFQPERARRGAQFVGLLAAGALRPRADRIGTCIPVGRQTGAVSYADRPLTIRETLILKRAFFRDRRSLIIDADVAWDVTPLGSVAARRRPHLGGIQSLVGIVHAPSQRRASCRKPPVARTCS